MLGFISAEKVAQADILAISPLIAALSASQIVNYCKCQFKPYICDVERCEEFQGVENAGSSVVYASSKW